MSKYELAVVVNAKIEDDERAAVVDKCKALIESSLLLKRGQRPKGGSSMSKYELAVVVNAKIEDDERAAVVDKCKALIERFGGTITNVDDWGKRRLAYEIQKMKEGFYYFIQFEAPTTAPAEIESRIRIMDNVLRYLVVKSEA